MPPAKTKPAAPTPTESKGGRDKTGRVPITPFRLTADTLDALDEVADHYGLRSRADVVRMLARERADTIRQVPAKQAPAKKSRRST
jgi:hypothetical protein